MRRFRLADRKDCDRTSPTSLDLKHEQALLYTLAGVQFAHILDFMIMMPLGPILMRELLVDTHQFGLLVSAYTLTAAITGILAAAFVDRFERKRLLLTTFTLFGLATLACGLAPSYGTLLLARSSAGAFGGVLRAMVETIVGDLIPFERRGRAAGTIMSAFSLATVLGIPLSLYLANDFGWRFPFIFIAILSCVILLLGWRMLPVLRGHLANSLVSENERAHPLSAMLAVMQDSNHLRALLFMAMVVSSGFTVIPYITIYLTTNVGVAQENIPLIYLIGGSATLFTSRLVGRLADTRGKAKVYRLMALLSLIPLFAITHMVPLPLWLVIVCTTLLFTLLTGRMVPAMAVITSAVQSRLRGTFLSINGAVQQLTSGIASYVGGLIISVDAAGHMVGYGTVGYLAVAATLAAIVAVGQIQLQTDATTGPSV